jgi:hypothetical protein
MRSMGSLSATTSGMGLTASESLIALMQVFDLFLKENVTLQASKKKEAEAQSYCRLGDACRGQTQTQRRRGDQADGQKAIIFVFHYFIAINLAISECARERRGGSSLARLRNIDCTSQEGARDGPAADLWRDGDGIGDPLLLRVAPR